MTNLNTLPDLSAQTVDDVDPDVDPRLVAEAQSSQWRLMWLAFRRNRLAMVGLVVVGFLYFVTAFAEFLAPFDAASYSSSAIYHPPQVLHFLDKNASGGTSFRPHVLAMKLERDPLTLKGAFVPDPDTKVYLTFFAQGWEYRLFGLIPTSLHLIGAAEPGERFYLLGADRLGRDMFSRIIAGTRISMSIGLVGVGLTLVLGVLLGGIAGYFGGKIDSAIQRLIEVVMSLPSIPIWLGLSAAMPSDWSSVTRYFAITLVLSLMAWVELARVVRGRFLALRNEEFVAAARLDGGSRLRIIFRHMLPSMTSHIIASVTLAVPAMILAETALSFLGLGLQPPTVSWGVLLQEVQNVRSLAVGPWLFAPAGVILVAVLSLNFMGDGLRDAADPYSQGMN
jgi:peptide/nickel transport system permease protein